jgi:glutamate carboxypeptidase
MNENAFIQTCYDAFLKDLQALVSVDCGTHNKAGVDQVGGWVGERCAAWGWAVERISQREFGDLWKASIRGQGSGRLVLLGHLDTVYPEGTAAARPMRLEGQKLLGPGVCDMKGGLLVGMYALRALQQAGFANFEEITFFFNSEEEIGSPVSEPIYLAEVQKADAALVLEAARANGNIVSARKGSGTYRIFITGHAAHAGVEPEKGINAVVELCQRVSALQGLNGIAPGVTVNVTLIGGGTATNAIPDSAWLALDVRAADQTGAQAVHQALTELAGRPSSIPGARARLEGAFRFPPMERTPAVAFLAGIALQVAAEQGLQIGESSTGGASDACPISAAGVPVLDGLGPVGGLDHSPEEYILQASILPRTTLLAGLIRRIFAEREPLAELRRS